MKNPEPPVITIAKEARYGNAPRPVFVPAGLQGIWKELGVRPKVLTDREDGRVYSLSPAQARKIMTRWESGLEASWHMYLEKPR